MNESYKELMVKRDRGFKERLLRTACMAVEVVLVLFMLLLMLSANSIAYLIMFVLAVAFGVLTYFVFQWTDIEYEYLYLDREITVDKVMAKTRRKRVKVLDVSKMEIMAPESSHRLDSYKNRQVKTVDLSAGHDIPGQKLYAVYYEGSCRFLLNLDEDFVKPIKLIAPRTVFTD